MVCFEKEKDEMERMENFDGASFLNLIYIVIIFLRFKVFNHKYFSTLSIKTLIIKVNKKSLFG